MLIPKICVVGSSNLDLNSYASRIPSPGETIIGDHFETGYGGKGANQAVMAARLGAAVTFVAKVGDDIFGRDMLDNFKQEGFDMAHVHVTSKAATGVATISIDTEGNNSIIVSPGANNLLIAAEIEAARPAIAASQVVVCQLEVPLDVTMATLRIAKEEGVTTILNPAPAPSEPLPAEIYPLCDIFCPNESEAELMTGQSVETLEEAEAAGRALLALGAGCVILTLGSRGSLLVEADSATPVSTTVVTAVDTTGAGDSFVGSLAYFLASGYEMVAAMERASQIAAVSVQTAGAQSSFPHRDSLPQQLFS